MVVPWEGNEIRSFLSSLDVTQNDWINIAEQWIKSKLRSAQAAKRVARFSVGDEEEEHDNFVNDNSLIMCEAGTQTLPETELEVIPETLRSIDEITSAWNEGKSICEQDALRLLKRGIVKSRELESRFSDPIKAIAIRRAYIAPNILTNLPFQNYDYKYVVNSCCENVIGYMPIPVGVAGPLRVNGQDIHVPLATTEGALVASTNRGCSAIKQSGGANAHVFGEGMTRAPVVKFPSSADAVKLKIWLENQENFAVIKEEFESTSRFAKLQRIDVAIDGNLAFVRFTAHTGDAMGMNMVSKGCSMAMRLLKERFPTMCLLALSGNYCVDKKAAAINWIAGRGRSVVSDCTLPATVVSSVFKTTPKLMVEAAQAKLRSGSDRAGCIGGNNAHAANIVAAIFIATGQDAAQVVSSSMCSTRMEETPEGNLYLSCTMPCIEVGTVGGGTILRPQNECLQLLSCAGPSLSSPGAHARHLAEVICATVLAGELSLMAALVTDQLVSSHMKLNRSRLCLYPSATVLPKTTSVEAHYFHKKIVEKEPKLKRNSVKVECSNIL